MKPLYFFKSLLLFTALTAIISCGADDSMYEEVPQVVSPTPEPGQVSPVVMDLNAVPYQNLSDYKFFDGQMKNLSPAYKVIPYGLNSELFTDYAKKKRFIWMPAGVLAEYAGDAALLEFPTGTALIKNFYYTNVLPANTTRIIETRVMIKKETGWIFASYVWNSDQTEAILTTEGSETEVTWNENNIENTVNYKIPSQTDCAVCHTSNNNFVPIGPKPQNLNRTYDYNGTTKNQLTRWVEEGYLKNTVPQNIVSTVDWTDASNSLDLRARSYLDINCAHCHADGGTFLIHLRFAFDKTTDPMNMGICDMPHDYTAAGQTHIVNKHSPETSILYFRMAATRPVDMMPRLGRTVVHTEGLQLMEDWINGMDAPCP